MVVEVVNGNMLLGVCERKGLDKVVIRVVTRCYHVGPRSTMLGSYVPLVVVRGSFLSLDDFVFVRQHLVVGSYNEPNQGDAPLVVELL